jgi:hypothetical protein
MDEAVHGQKLSVDTVRASVPPSWPIVLEPGVMLMLQLAACCTNVTRWFDTERSTDLV